MKILGPKEIGHGILIEYDAGSISPKQNSKVLVKSTWDENSYLKITFQRRDFAFMLFLLVEMDISWAFLSVSPPKIAIWRVLWKFKGSGITGKQREID